MRQMMVLIIPVLLRCGPVQAADQPHTSWPEDSSLCQRAIDVAGQGSRLPPLLLSAIGVVESGRVNPRTGVVAPWPWTININGIGYFFPTKLDGIAAVATAQSAGIQSIDIGCMQVNLMHHPHAFSNLEEAFDPVANATYAASFLLELHQQTKNWGWAAIGYHSFTPELGVQYSRRLAAVWPFARSYGLPVSGDVTKNVDLSKAAPTVDPYNVMTPEFRVRLGNAEAFRRARDLRMKFGP